MLIANVAGSEWSLVAFPPISVKAEFRADWGATTTGFKPRPGLDHHDGAVAWILARKGYGGLLVLCLFNQPVDMHTYLTAFHAARFAEPWQLPHGE